MNSFAWRASQTTIGGAPGVKRLGQLALWGGAVGGSVSIGPFLFQNTREIQPFVEGLVLGGWDPPPSSPGGYYGLLIHEIVTFDPNDYFYEDYYNGL